MRMSAPPAKSSSAPTTENELQSQPMDLASKPNLTIGGNTTAPARQLITESKPIILVISFQVFSISNMVIDVWFTAYTPYIKFRIFKIIILFKI